MNILQAKRVWKERHPCVLTGMVIHEKFMPCVTELLLDDAVDGSIAGCRFACSSEQLQIGQLEMLLGNVGS